jgi:hypothetical protein
VRNAICRVPAESRSIGRFPGNKMPPPPALRFKPRYRAIFPMQFDAIL